MRRMIAFGLGLMLAAGGFAPLGAVAQSSSAAQNGVSWMRANQQADGGFPGFGAGDTADAIQALVAAGESPAAFVNGGNSPLDFLNAQGADYAATSVGAAAKLVMAAVAAGEDPATFAGVDLPALIDQSYDSATGQYGPDVYGHALALLALRAIGEPIPNAAIGRLSELQLDDGGWSFDGTADTGSDTNTTSLVIQALTGQRQADGIRAQALDYLRNQQNADGGFPYSQASSFGNASDANSTASAIQAIRAAGQDPASAEWTQADGNPLEFLASLQNDSGAFRYQTEVPDDNALATYQAIPALLLQPLPVRVIGATVTTGSTATTPALPATGAEADALLLLLVLSGCALAGGAMLRRVAR